MMLALKPMLSNSLRIFTWKILVAIDPLILLVDYQYLRAEDIAFLSQEKFQRRGSKRYFKNWTAESPCVDGLLSIFYQKQYNIVGESVIAFVKNVL